METLISKTKHEPVVASLQEILSEDPKMEAALIASLNIAVKAAKEKLNPDLYKAIDNVFQGTTLIPGYASRLNEIFKDVTWVVNARKSASQPVGSGNYDIKIRVNHYFKTNKEGNDIPEYMFSTDDYVPEIGDDDYLSSLLDLIRAVPNPYYAYSEYESDQVSNVMRITNLPVQCNIAIYTVSGTLVRAFQKNDNDPFLEWDLKNENGLPIASGCLLYTSDAADD